MTPYQIINKPWVAIALVCRARRLAKARRALQERELVEFWESMMRTHRKAKVFHAECQRIRLSQTVRPTTKLERLKDQQAKRITAAADRERQLDQVIADKQREIDNLEATLETPAAQGLRIINCTIRKAGTL